MPPPPDANQIIQGLWVGSRLSEMEQLSIASFLQNGHEYHLYVYNDIDGVPPGTVIKDASEILPSSAIFQYKKRPSFAGFADMFRFKLMYERGGWWADSDMVCLRPFDFPEPYVISSEMNTGKELTNVGVIKAPQRSAAMAYAYDICRTKNPAKIKWGEIGPGLMAEVVSKFGLIEYQKPYYTFCPISEWQKLLEPYVAAIHPDSYAIHLWNESWRLANQDKNKAYHSECIYEQLKCLYLGNRHLVITAEL
ncbi:MAG TPA: glycosyltransferase [Pyrinomonadaceae bacterium]|nr:glycosyltransferase [Pyrinomonadaceae bacterium]